MQLLTSLAHAATKRSPRNLAFSYKPKDRLLRMQPAKYSSMHCLPAPQRLANYPLPPFGVVRVLQQQGVQRMAGLVWLVWLKRQPCTGSEVITYSC
jgi:hypothetical protein